MITVATAAPSAAESVRSTCARTHHGLLSIAGRSPVAATVHALRPPGTVVLAVPTADVTTEPGGVGETEIPALVELADHSPLHLRERVRSLVWFRGRLSAVPDQRVRPLIATLAETHPHESLLDVGHTSTLLVLELVSVVTADSRGAGSVPVADVMEAEPDPFTHIESAWLHHLDTHHLDMVQAISRRLPRSLRTGVPRPLAVDRYGITLRIEGPNDDLDVRVPFATPVTDPAGLGRALRVLIGCPFLNGLRAGG